MKNRFLDVKYKRKPYIEGVFMSKQSKELKKLYKKLIDDIFDNFDDYQEEEKNNGGKVFMESQGFK